MSEARFTVDTVVHHERAHKVDVNIIPNGTIAHHMTNIHAGQIIQVII